MNVCFNSILQPDEAETQISLDKTRFVLVNAQKKDQAVYTCVAKNAAGQVEQDFDVYVIGT